jgi:hypothetical protein
LNIFLATLPRIFDIINKVNGHGDAGDAGVTVIGVNEKQGSHDLYMHSLMWLNINLAKLFLHCHTVHIFCMPCAECPL